MRSRLLLALCLSTSALACSDQPEMLVDTSDARFEWRCSKDVCEFGVLPETPEPVWCPEADVPGYSYVWGRFIEVLSVCGDPDGSGWSAGYGDGRFLACDADEDCPQLDFYEHPSWYECSAGLCQNVDTERFPRDSGFVSQNEAVNLCLAEAPRAEGDIVAIQALILYHCGPNSAPCPLPLPDPCWQP
jgi:hypothetical protein